MQAAVEIDLPGDRLLNCFTGSELQVVGGQLPALDAIGDKVANLRRRCIAGAAIVNVDLELNHLAEDGRVDVATNIGGGDLDIDAGISFDTNLRAIIALAFLGNFLVRVNAQRVNRLAR